jgi:hypothetical protein
MPQAGLATGNPDLVANQSRQGFATHAPNSIMLQCGLAPNMGK